MNALFGIGIIAAIIYGIVRDAFFWKIYGVLFLLYLLFVLISVNRKDNHKRRTMTLSTWSRKFLANPIFISNLT
jgi:cell shape-determining protein MreD